MTEAIKGQMSLSDLDGWCGKTYPVRSVREQTTKAKTSASSLKKQQGSSKKMPLYLDLRKKDGTTQESSWGTGILWHGESQMLSGGESHSEDGVYACLLTSTDTPHQTRCLTVCTGEKPRTPVPTKLQQILEDTVPDKYFLSQKACQGILNRAERRGKTLPETLEKALRLQAAV